jgi:hypothetical protein
MYYVIDKKSRAFTRLFTFRRKFDARRRERRNILSVPWAASRFEAGECSAKARGTRERPTSYNRYDANRSAPPSSLTKSQGEKMKISSAIRVALLALTAFAGSSLSSASADSGTVSLVIYKAGWIIGGSGGSGVLNFRGRTYALSTGGLDYGLVFGGSKTVLHGRVSNINRPSDVAGVYGAAGAGLAVGSGARAIVLTNQKGAVLELSGRQVGLMANADLSGLAITLK